jgi:hypothetical protein
MVLVVISCPVLQIGLSEAGMRALLEEAKSAALAGWSGKQVIHPKQVWAAPGPRGAVSVPVEQHDSPEVVSWVQEQLRAAAVLGSSREGGLLVQTLKPLQLTKQQ